MNNCIINSLEEFMGQQYIFAEIPSIGRLFQDGKEELMKHYEKEIFMILSVSFHCLLMFVLKMTKSSCF